MCCAFDVEQSTSARQSAVTNLSTPTSRSIVAPCSVHSLPACLPACCCCVVVFAVCWVLMCVDVCMHGPSRLLAKKSRLQFSQPACLPACLPAVVVFVVCWVLMCVDVCMHGPSRLLAKKSRLQFSQSACLPACCCCVVVLLCVVCCVLCAMPCVHAWSISPFGQEVALAVFTVCLPACLLLLCWCVDVC